MRKLKPILIFFLLCSCTTLKKPFFYEISGKDGKAYVLGTIHSGVPMDDLPFYVMNRFNQAKKIGAESDPLSERLLGDEIRELTKDVDYLIQKSDTALKKNLYRQLRS